jgi:surfactin synthase thioesterase subunit
MPAPISRASASEATSRKKGSKTWLFPLRPQLSNAVSARILVFPYAAAGALSMRPLVCGLPASVDLLGVSLPGRERRFSESPAVTVGEILTGVDAELENLDLMPTYFLGHSMGASLALAKAISAPESCAGLVISGRLPRREVAESELDMTDSDALVLLRKLGNTASGLLEDPYWRERLIDLFRHDSVLDAEATLLTNVGLLHKPILALGGVDDPFVDAHELGTWKNRTGERCQVQVFPGNHFYLFSSENLLPVGKAICDFIGCS